MSERSASAPSAHIRPPQRTLTQQVTRFGTRLMLQSFRVRMQVGAFVRPRHTLQRACDVFCMPGRRPPPGKASLPNASRTILESDGRRIAVYRHGSGAERPYALLSHGWGSDAGCFAPWIPSLDAAGYDVVAFDHVAHGGSDGRRSDLPTFVRTLAAVVERHGAPAVVIGHSLGASAAAIALARGLPVERAILLAPSADLGAAIRRFNDALGLREDFADRMIDEFEVRGIPVRSLHARAYAPAIANPGLVFHDAHDRHIPYAEGRSLSELWPGASFVPTQGLGHVRILSDPSVIETACTYLNAGVPEGRA